MPYITKDRKAEMKLGHQPKTAGDLNFLFTTAILNYIRGKGLKYQTINDVVGALASCSDEFYRRIVSPYENTKIKSNGDVYEDLLKDTKLGV
jgi:hypothetical protein